MGHLRIFFISLLLLNASGALGTKPLLRPRGNLAFPVLILPSFYHFHTLAATIHVQSTGTNNPGCSQASPCATVAYGLSQAVSGDTIQIGVRIVQLMNQFAFLFHSMKSCADFLPPLSPDSFVYHFPSRRLPFPAWHVHRARAEYYNNESYYYGLW